MDGSHSDYDSDSMAEVESPETSNQGSLKIVTTPSQSWLKSATPPNTPPPLPKRKKRAPSPRLPPMPDLEEAYHEPWSLAKDAASSSGVVKLFFTDPAVKVVKDAEGNEVVSKPTAEEMKAFREAHLGKKLEQEERSKRKKAREVSSKDIPELPDRVFLNPTEQQWQACMDLAVAMLVPCKVDLKDLTMMPDQGTLECFKRCAQQWCADNKKHLPLTFSTHKTVYGLIGRFLLDFCIKAAKLNPVNWAPSGCAIWRHGWSAEGGPRCLHGTVMLRKEQVVEMDVNSENGQRALKEQASRVKIVPNRWGRQVVQIRNEEAVCCPMDAAMSAGSFSSSSCSMFFTEGTKAWDAMQQWMQYMRACYPKMADAEKRLLIPLTCDCNWGNGGVPLLGRQTCKMTPYSLSGGLNVDLKSVEDPKIRASVSHPTIMVFQCCNPVFGRSKGTTQKNCDFKISSVDVIAALQLAKQIWMSFHHTPVPLTIPEFVWSPKFQHHSVILPTDQHDEDDSLF